MPQPPTPADQWPSWRRATEQALYGPGGFYHRPEGPAGHFRTSTQASGLFATALVRLAEAVDDQLGRPDRFDLVEIAAGRGQLLLALAGQLADSEQLRGRVRLVGVERAARPPGLPAELEWATAPARGLVGLVVANEWLDNVAVDVAEVAPDGLLRRVLVDPATGREQLGPVVTGADADWLARWWPLTDQPVGARAEIGAPRDLAWAETVAAVGAGLAVAVDYGHLRAERVAGRYPAGTLTGYRYGRSVAPVPDGSTDLTSHLAVDACAAAGRRAGAAGTLLVSQRAALRALGVSGARPEPGLVHSDPAGYLRLLARAGEAAELTDPVGLGGFWWLAQSVGLGLPGLLAGLAELATGSAAPGAVGWGPDRGGRAGGGEDAAGQ